MRDFIFPFLKGSFNFNKTLCFLVDVYNIVPTDNKRLLQCIDSVTARLIYHGMKFPH